MSVSIMKRLNAYVCAADAEALSARLVRLRCVDVEVTPLIEGELERNDCSERIRECEKECERIEAALGSLYRYGTRKKTLVKSKIDIDKDAFAADGRADAARATVDAVIADCGRLEEIVKAKAALEATVRAALPWESYDLPLGCAGTDTSRIILGSLPAGVGNTELEDRLGGLAAAYREINRTATAGYFMFVTANEDADMLLRRLSQSGFVRAEFAADSGTAKNIIDTCDKTAAAYDSEKEELTENLKKYASQLDGLEILWDITGTELAEGKLRDRLARTGEVLVLRGWVPEKTAEKVTQVLSATECAFDLEEPEKDDDVPVKLENNAFARNFEWVVGMYSLPAYGTYDPTFIMSLFYVILFAVMFADVGYGLLLVLGGFLLPRLLKFNESTTRAFNMFAYCGIGSIITGVLFGGYFGDMPLAIARAVNPDAVLPQTLALVVDPVADPMNFLFIGIGLGIVHLITGQAVNFAIMWKKGQRLDALLDHVPIWLLYVGIGLLVIVPSFGMWFAIAAAVIAVLAGGRKEKNIFMRLPKGLLSLYGLINFGSDIISYARILALALSGTVMAQVINILGTMAKGNPVALAVNMILVFALGHTLNIAISVLGSFVHTSRLQYIEFFGKFYEDGGRPYAPMLPSGRFTNA